MEAKIGRGFRNMYLSRFYVNEDLIKGATSSVHMILNRNVPPCQ